VAAESQQRVRLLPVVLRQISLNLESMITAIDQNDAKSRMRDTAFPVSPRGRGVSDLLPRPRTEIVKVHKKGGAAVQPHRLLIDSYAGD
jgi:hypothetical protein